MQQFNPQPVSPATGSSGAPKAVRTFVKMTGVTSLPDRESQELQSALGALSECLMQLSEMQNDATMPDNVRGERLFNVMPRVESSLADVIRLGGCGLAMLNGTYREEGISKHQRAFALQQQISRVYIQPSTPEQCIKTQDDARVISSLVISTIECVMEVFAIFDRMTLDHVKEMVDNAKKTVLDICNEFIMGKDPQQAAEYLATNSGAVTKLVDLSNVYSMLMTDLLKVFISRMAFLPGERFRVELDGIIQSLRDLTPKLILVAQGRLTEPGVVDRLLGAVDEGNELIKAVPRFSARVEMEFVGGGSLEISASNLRNSVVTMSVQDIGRTARAYAMEVSNVVSQCRAMGINAIDCDEVQRALANVIRLAKTAVVSGDPDDIRRFEQAVEELNKLVAALPSKFKLVFYDEVCFHISFFLVLLLLINCVCVFAVFERIRCSKGAYQHWSCRFRLQHAVISLISSAAPSNVKQVLYYYQSTLSIISTIQSYSYYLLQSQAV